MSKYIFDFSIDTSGMCKISISNLGIIFSKEAIEALGAPKKVHIGLDKGKKVLGVCAAEENSTIKTFDFATTEARKKWLRVQSKVLVREIEKLIKKQFTGKADSFPARIDEDEGTKFLVIELSKK